MPVLEDSLYFLRFLKDIQTFNLWKMACMSYPEEIAFLPFFLEVSSCRLSGYFRKVFISTDDIEWVVGVVRIWIPLKNTDMVWEYVLF